eukprot:CAMPEP_0180119720 /NCGR_PEP_ID=MMETSP0986-20121125/2137_1 /TAXON_ID=697907 /ORGANISM="non described non described, Strain CCMP2293" /LENGTH=84 /DNA_ID=CAMNT_0022058749 /DNA_START=175 /DNA_END=429 /DNA_ORIENTATION=-
MPLLNDHASWEVMGQRFKDAKICEPAASCHDELKDDSPTRAVAQRQGASRTCAVEPYVSKRTRTQGPAPFVKKANLVDLADVIC